MSLAAAIERATKFSLWLHAQSDQAAWECDDRQRACLALLQHSLDLADAVVVLINRRLPGPALTLARPLFEGYVRAHWLFKRATDVQFAKAVRGSFPLFKDILATLGDDAETGAAWIKNNKVANWTSFNGLTHGGSEHIHRRINETSIEPIYPDEELERLLDFSLETAIRIGVEMYSVVEDVDRMEALHAQVMKLRRWSIVVSETT